MNKASEIWEAALGELQLQITKPNYETWLKDTAGLSYQDNAFVVEVPNTFTASWLQKCLHARVKSTLSRIAGQDLEVEFRVSTKDNPAPASPPPTTHQRRPVTISAPQPVSVPRLNPKYTFDNFIVGSCNRLAYAASLGVAESPGQSYNPLFIYANVGLGKTHLLHALAHAAAQNDLNYLYVTTEQFTNDFIRALRGRKTEEFRAKYRSVDLLLVDDIQFIAGKEQTQEVFFHTFNDLYW